MEDKVSLTKGRKVREGYGQVGYQVYFDYRNQAPLFMSNEHAMRENYWTSVAWVLLWAPACPTRLTRVQHQKHQIIKYGHKYCYHHNNRTFRVLTDSRTSSGSME